MLNKPNYLFVRRKETFGYSDLVRGKYPIYNKTFIQNLVNEMTLDEKKKIKISQITSSFIFVDEILGEYRRHELGASSSVLRHLNAELAVVDQHISHAQKKDVFSFKARNRKAKAIYSAGRTCMRVKEYRLAFSFFFRAIIKSPFFIRSYAALALTVARWVVRK